MASRRLSSISITVFPGDRMVLSGTVAKVEVDVTGCAWIEVDVALRVDAAIMTECLVRMALPADPDDNPWSRPAERWHQGGGRKCRSKEEATC